MPCCHIPHSHMLAHMQPELEIVLTPKYDVGYYWYFSLVPHTPPCTFSHVTDNIHIFNSAISLQLSLQYLLLVCVAKFSNVSLTPHTTQ